MASTGQLVGSIVGFGIGSLFGFGAGGMALGGMIGLWLDPPDPPDPPALGDLSCNSYVRSMPVPIAYGQNKIYGGVIWMGNNRVEMENEGSRKQPQYSASYYADFVVAMCEGTIGGYVKYMINDKDLSELKDEDKIALNFTGVLGDGTQTIDPLVESTLTDGTAIPWRWTAHVLASGKIGGANTLPAFSSVVNTLLCESDSQANPIKVLYDFMTNGRYGMGIDTTIFDGSPITSGSWKTAADYCDESVGIGTVSNSFNVITNENNSSVEIYADLSAYVDGYWNGASGKIVIGNATLTFTVLVQGQTFMNVTDIGGNPTGGNTFTLYIYGSFVEPRFRYSNVLTNRVKGYDIVAEILQTCRGFIYYAEGMLKILIANANEVPIFYFSDGHQVSFETLGSCTYTRIYADFSAYPEHYWDGDIINIQLSAYYCEMIAVLGQTSTYIDLIDELTEVPSSGITFDIRKENIKKDTFTYSRKGTRDKVNRFRTEFINKDDLFRTDYIEEDNVYDINITDEIREGTAQVNGIKRKSQAARMNSFFLDFVSYVDYACNFETDIVGYFLTVGAIIGITESLPQWNCKLFRVITLDEGEDWSVKVSCLEYVPTVFHDAATPIIPTQSYSLPNPYITPINPTRYEAFEDGLSNKIYFCFNRPENEPNWVGVLIFADFGFGYTYLSTYYITTPSVKLDAAINESDTIIAYDATTIYSSFPASGTFFIGEEEIYYASIDDINDQFLGCIRGHNNSYADSHADTAYCYLHQANTPSYTYDPMYIGCSITFKAVSVNAYDIYGDSTTAPTDIIDVNGFYYTPKSVSGLEINELGNGTFLDIDSDCHIYWQAVTDGINKGYGYKYADGYGYGDGELEGFTKYMVRIYKTIDDTLLHEEEITDLSIQDFNYTHAMNDTDNGEVFESNLTIKVYQVNSSLLFSPVRTLITNV